MLNEVLHFPTGHFAWFVSITGPCSTTTAHFALILQLMVIFPSLAFFDWSNRTLSLISLDPYVTQIHIYRSRATLSVSPSLIQQWILADHIPPSLDLDPIPPRSFTTSHLIHIQTTHPSATSLSRRVPRRHVGSKTSQTNRSCTGLRFPMHHIDPLHPASCMLLLHGWKERSIY